MNPKPREFHFNELEPLRERRNELKNSLDKWRYRLDVFTNPHLLENPKNVPAYLDPKNPLELKTYERALLTMKGLDIMKQISFSPSLFDQNLVPFKSGLAGLLAAKGPKCSDALIAAVGIFTAADMRGSNLAERAQELAGFAADARAQIGNIASIPGVVNTLGEVGSAKSKELKEKVAQTVDTALNALGNYLTPDQKAIIKDWFLWDHAKALQATAKAIGNFEAPDLVPQVIVILNTLSTFYPTMDVTTENKVMKPTESFVQQTMDNSISTFINNFQKSGALEVASYMEHDKWVSDAAASAINTIGYGIDLSNGLKLPTPFQAVAIAVATQMMRQMKRLNQATIEKKYTI